MFTNQHEQQRSQELTADEQKIAEIITAWKTIKPERQRRVYYKLWRQHIHQKRFIDGWVKFPMSMLIVTAVSILSGVEWC